MSDTMNFK